MKGNRTFLFTLACTVMTAFNTPICSMNEMFPGEWRLRAVPHPKHNTSSRCHNQPIRRGQINRDTSGIDAYDWVPRAACHRPVYSSAVLLKWLLKQTPGNVLFLGESIMMNIWQEIAESLAEAGQHCCRGIYFDKLLTLRLRFERADGSIARFDGLRLHDAKLEASKKLNQTTFDEYQTVGESVRAHS